MYNEELEMLIDAALADGELTEKEKQVLFKKAQALGVDLDEFEMVLDARLVKLKQKQDEETKTSAPKSNKYGDVKKCPACGAIVQSYQGSCPECGYAFEGVDANAAVKELASLLQGVGMERGERKGIISQTYGMGFDAARDSLRTVRIINSFPIPIEKAALLAFVTWLSAQKHGINGDLTITNAYKRKYEECIRKIKVAFPNDEVFSSIIAEYNQKKRKKRIIWSIIIIIAIVVAISIGII